MLSKNAEYLLERRYCKQGETPLGVLKRTAEYLSMDNRKLERRFYKLMTDNIFFPNSPALFNAGNSKGSLHACFILPIYDDLTGIFKMLTYMGTIFKSGGGVGINFSPLREKGCPLSGGGASSGVISFERLFDTAVDVVMQGGHRRGAVMGILNYNHPEIYNFIVSKLRGKLTNFNISVLVTDEFMDMVCNGEKNSMVKLVSPKRGIVGETKAVDIFNNICFAAWIGGDPGLLFKDRINKDNPFYPDIVIDTCNPCSEVAMPHYSACCLGSINLSKFVWKNKFDHEDFGEACITAMQVLHNMNKLSYFPAPEITEAMNKYNPVGVGIMGFADTLIQLGIYYDSDECLKFIDEIGKTYQEATNSYKSDEFFFYRRIIAPTGSLSILSDCSPGIEPIYDVSFKRQLVVGIVEEARDLYKSKFARFAHQVSLEWHVKVLAQWQKWVDGGVSKTINMPDSASTEDIKEAYIQAWKSGCKGITIYRDKSLDTQVLISPTPQQAKCADETCVL